MVLYQSMSLTQSPLKSWVVVGGTLKTHAAPALRLSCGPPRTAVLQDSATEAPCWTLDPTAPVPTSLLPCWLHTPPLRVNTQVAPALPLSIRPPTRAVLPPG